MKTVKTFLFAFALLLAGHVLSAQQQTQRSAAEVLEIELANKATAIPPVPVDEKLPATATTEPATMSSSPVPVANPLFLRTGKEEKLAAQPDPRHRIPDPPVEESQVTVPVTTLQALPADASTEQQKTTEKPSSPADPEALESQQHQQNGIRAIPAPPKEESTSNQH